MYNLLLFKIPYFYGFVSNQTKISSIRFTGNASSGIVQHINSHAKAIKDSKNCLKGAKAVS